ncbi:hypothetical protein HPB50_012740 [Hyalomma asiaticum]|uniref:Uncharacterized protein n=1 Tax=Hyalomma asiaticum TaxID=266040 RepID=A0ACB7TLQ0_HYAAI|nr:hypothetical protein HPB50_012740 [Hyalomma asiaticum]
MRQAHPTFAAYLRGSKFRDLDELASEAKRIQADILASRAYRPPPPASEALEPRCAWNGDNFRTRPQGNGLLAFSDERSSSGWELSDRALDPYTYARRAACAADGRGEEALVCTATFHHRAFSQGERAVVRASPAPAAPNVSRAQDQLNDSSSSSPGTPPWTATADEPPTTAAERRDSPPHRHDVLDGVVDNCPSVSPR